MVPPSFAVTFRRRAAPAIVMLLVVGGLLITGAPAPADPGPGSPPSLAGTDVHHDVSPALATLHGSASAPNQKGESDAAEERRKDHLPKPRVAPGVTDPVRQTSVAAALPAIATSWDGVGEGFVGPSGTYPIGGTLHMPPDTSLDVGTSQVVELVNASLAVFSKTGTILYGPVLTNTLWAGFGGLCATDNDGDGTVVYDRLANRWVVSQFAYVGADGSTVPYLQCVAVSQTADALGAWNRYSFAYSVFPDYPKLSVWPDAYYTTFNTFDNFDNFTGGLVCAYDRAKMLTGAAAGQQCVNNTIYSSFLVATYEGGAAPAAGVAAYVIDIEDGTHLATWRFAVNWTTPANTRLTGPTNLAVAAFSLPCGFAGDCIPEVRTDYLLDSLGDRLMARYIYRNIGGVASLVVSHSVGDPLVGVRWYEFRPAVLGGAPVLYQQGTLSPDSTYRWMPAISMDSAGDIALVYSAGSSALAPGIRVAGRLVGDPHGVLSQGESTLISGTGVQPVEDRWGDYAAMVVDPANGCTFWFASEYLVTDGAYNWHTRVGSFRFPSCTPVGPPPSSTPGPSLTPGPSSSGSPDITPPTVSSLATSGALLTNAATVPYALAFGESVTGLTAGDFTRTGTATSCSVGSPVGSGASYTIAISGCSAGTVILTLNANTVRDLANNLGPTGSASAATVRIDRTGPTATLIAQFSPTNAASLAYQISFNESVTGLTAGDFTRTGTATGCVVFPPLGSGSSYSLAITTCSAGTVLLSLKSASVQDGAGNIGPALAVAAASVTLDRTAPTVTAPAMSLRSGVTVTGSSMPVHLAWTGADTGGAGVKSYDLARSTDAAAFATIATGLTSASYNLSLTSGHSYRFETRAHDAAGNVGGWLAGPTIHPTLLQQTSTSITYYRTWTTSTSTVYSGGSSRHATAAGAYARYSFTGRSISAVLARGPTRGAVKVYIDGVYVSTVNLYSATYSYRYVAFARTWSTSGAHSIKLVVVGTSGRPRVDLDAFEVLR